jgi:D-psicose/D-tagatose/L-ribulose 3-epimerase
MSLQQSTPHHGTTKGPTGRPLIGINTFVWHSPINDVELADVARRIAGWGYEAIEIPLENPGDWDPETTRDLLDGLGLTPVVCGVMAPGRELAVAPDHVVAETQDYLRHCVDVAATIGAKYVVGPLYTSVGRTWRMPAEDRTAMMRDLREALRPIGDYAGERGVAIGVEPLNRYETSVLNTTAQALDLIDGLPAQSVGLNLDTYHMNIEDKSIPGGLRDAGERLLHLQVCANDRGAPGQDHLDWDGIRSALVDIGYDGVLGIESFTADNETIATAASIWRPLAPTQDTLARDGLDFLRRWTEGWGA